jgi:hypothetical protein
MWVKVEKLFITMNNTKFLSQVSYRNPFIKTYTHSRILNESYNIKYQLLAFV